jgi:hypothetical protein
MESLAYGTSSTLIVLDLPLNSTFGFDAHVFTTGPLFRGIKFIPQGLHFAHYMIAKDATVGLQHGFWFEAEADGDIHIYKYLAEREEVVGEDQLDRLECMRLRAGRMPSL